MSTFAVAVLLILHSAPVLIEGDAEYVRLEYARAESLYTQALAESPNDPEALWRLSRLYICIADVSPHEAKERLYRKAETLARSCTVNDDTKTEGHTWLAASLGNIAMYEGGETKVRLAREIQAELSRALALNPRDDIAYSILGSFYRALGSVSWVERQIANLLLGGLPDGGYAEAEVALKHAITIAPEVMRHHHELGMLYIEWERESEARLELLQALRVPVSVKSDSTRRREINDILQHLSQ